MSNPESGRRITAEEGKAPQYLIFKNSIYAVGEIESIKWDCITECIRICGRNGTQSTEPADEKYWEKLKNVFINGLG